MTHSWHDLYTDGKRLNRIIRYLETKMKKATDDDKIIRYANSIAFLTGKKVEIVDKVLGVEHIVKGSVRDYNKTHEIPYDPSEKYRTNSENS